MQQLDGLLMSGSMFFFWHLPRVQEGEGGGGGAKLFIIIKTHSHSEHYNQPKCAVPETLHVV